MINKLILAVTPGEEQEAERTGAAAAHIAYQMGKGPHLYRGGGPAAARGGYMVIGDADYAGGENAEPFVLEVTRECAGRGFSGVLLDFERRPEALTRRIAQLLDGALQKQGRTLYLPEAYAEDAPHARVLIGSALSGGSLEFRLREAAERYGAPRVVLAVERVAMDFFLPAVDGMGKPLTEQALQALLEKRSPSVFFSRELCARYFTYMNNENGAHFILFDDAASIREKLRLAAGLGIDEAFLTWSEVREFWGELMK